MSDDLGYEPSMRTDIPQSARIWNYWMGGKDHYEMDRIVGDGCIEVDPDIVTMAVQSRQFLIRAVNYLAAEHGIRQFIDIGCGLPTMRNTHEVAQAVAPDTRIVYVDNDRLVLAHARALLTSTTAEGIVTHFHADVRDPEWIISDAKHDLNFQEPIAVMLMGVLSFVDDYDEVRRIVDTLMKAVPSGSYLMMWHVTDDSQRFRFMCELYAGHGDAPLVPRLRSQVEALFDGLEMVEPGFVSITQWRSGEPEVGSVRAVSAYGAVARKPG
ncbi:SAM-dependent methyltransferase [Nocardia gipuzkoensis]